jgi:hypothetical protein
MRTPVVVASTWSASQAELLAQHLRARGIESFTKTNLDRVAYGGELGGAKVFVDADQRLEAELEIVLLHEDDDSDEPRSGAAAPPFATRWPPAQWCPRFDRSGRRWRSRHGVQGSADDCSTVSVGT